MRTLVLVYIFASSFVLILSFFADITDRRFGLKRWYDAKKPHSIVLKLSALLHPMRPWRVVSRTVARYPRLSLSFASLLAVHIWLHFANPYASLSFFESPYRTFVAANGEISYQQVYTSLVLTDAVSDFAGYYRSGYLIAENTLVGGKPIREKSTERIIQQIHETRFDPSKPYLISGDQFSVLYPRNLGVFYNQILDPNTALSPKDWQDRQRIYLQSTLFAIDGLSHGDTPKTTLVPIAPRTYTTTSVHPGDIASDAVYGTLYALNALASTRASDDGRYSVRTQQATQKLLRERHTQLVHMVDRYVAAVQDKPTGLVRSSIHLSSARDGASRQSSFYDNVVLWKTLELANTLGIRTTPTATRDALKNTIKRSYWNEAHHYYNNDRYDTSFSSDWLIGYVTGFFDLKDPTDRARTQQTVNYISKTTLATPLPIKYQIGSAKKMPWAVKVFVPNYGGEAIWSYWGVEYITLLANLSKETGDRSYYQQARAYEAAYNAAIVRDGGFAETFDSDGKFLQNGVYKSIRITGWVVQFEHATYLLRRQSSTTAIDRTRSYHTLLNQ